MIDTTTMMTLAIIATVVVLYHINRSPGKKKIMKKTSTPTEPVGKARNRAQAIRRTRRAKGPVDCSKVPIDSPDFERCAQTLGAGRSVIRSHPRADRMKNKFMKNDYNIKPNVATESLGNPFAVKLNDNVNKDTNKKLGAQAFPFTANSKHKPAPPRGSSRASVSLGSTHEGGMGYNQAFLGAAVSPSSQSLGASPEEIAQAAQKLDDVNKVASNTGGNLNLLHPL